MSDSTVMKSVLQRDRVVVLAALIAVTALSWWYLIDMARDMGDMDMSSMDMPEDASAMDMSGTNMEIPMPADAGMGEMDMGSAMPVDSGSDDAKPMAMDMMQIQAWTPAYFAMMFLMWAIMMVGMMVPSAAPMLLTYTGFIRNQDGASPYRSAAAFLGGYLFVWTAFSLAATTLQWGLDTAALLSPMMVSTSPWLGAGLLIAAGIFQLTPWKDACLVHCRSPLQFFMQHWRKGTSGAFQMGLHHGAFCLGCCWLLMGLLFLGGVMNLLWIAAITAFVLLEKVAPLGPAAGKVSGALMIVSGIAFFAVNAL